MQVPCSLLAFRQSSRYTLLVIRELSSFCLFSLSVKQQSYLLVAVLVLLAVTATSACSRDSSPSVHETAGVSDSARQEYPQRTPTHSGVQRAADAVQTPGESTDCQVGQVIELGGRCNYPDTSDEFSVDALGVGRFLFLVANSSMNARNANINGQHYDFAASKQSDGSWAIEIAGGWSDSIRVSDLIAAATHTPIPTATPVPLASPTATPNAVTDPPGHLPSPTIEVVSPATPTATATPIPASSPSPSPTAIRAEIPRVVPRLTSTPASPEAEVAVVQTSVPLETSTPVATYQEPVLLPWADQVVKADEQVVLDASQVFPGIVDDGVKLYSVQVGNSSVGRARADSYSGLVTLTGLRPGLTWVVLQACNAQGCSELGAKTISMTVPPPPNRRPQAVRHLDDQSVRVGEIATLAVASAFWDLEGDEFIDYKMQIAADGIATGTVLAPEGRITLQGLKTGATSVSVRACDSEGCGVGDQALKFDLDVLPPRNQPPNPVGTIADQALDVGGTVILDLASLFSDPEADRIQDYGLRLSDRSVVVGRVDSEEGTLTLRGAKAGTSAAAIDAQDIGSKARSEPLTFRMTVSEPPRTPPRIVGTISDQTLDLGDSIEVMVSHAFVTSSRYRIIRYDFLLKDPEIASDSEISRDGRLNLEGSEEGRSWVSIRACNYSGCSNFSDLSFVLTVVDSDKRPNRSPEVVGALQNRRLRVGETVTFDVSGAFSDLDDDSIVDYQYELSNRRPIVASSITNTGVLSLHGAREGTTKVYLSACDEENVCRDPEEMSFTLTVEATPGNG